MSGTVLDRLVARINTTFTYNEGAQVAPAALLWPDETRQWQPAVERLGEHLPIVTLGAYDPARRTGPAYWIRCVVAGTIDVGLIDGTPVVYLPGVARSEFHAVDTCPAALAPIAELQYRSPEFNQPKSKRDWTVRGLLTNTDHGLGLQVAGDTATGEALLLALDRFLDQPFERLLNQVLDADYFRDLVNPDPVRSLLAWLDDPAGYQTRLAPAQWAAFVAQCQADYRLNPGVDGELTGARQLASREGAWAKAWVEYAYDPRRYPGIPARLRQAKPLELTFEPSEVWPQDNEAAEDQTRNLLVDFENLTPEGSRKEALSLDARHAWRRRTVWADLDEAPLAFALEQLAILARATSEPLGSGDLDTVVEDFAERGWRADDAALRALAATKSGKNRIAVAAAVRSMYRAWLDAAAAGLQQAVGPLANAGNYAAGMPASTAAGTVTVFVDGLRLDVAHRLAELLAGGGLEVDISTSLAALPTVTETAKPTLVPVAKGALVAGPELYAARAAGGVKASKPVLEALATANGVRCLTPTETGDPAGTAWTETGQVDHLGHQSGVGLVDDLDREVSRIADRIRELLDAGWFQVDVVTDHGWMLLPGGLEKVELPVGTTEKKKGRCARLKEGAVVNVPTVPWFWDRDVRIATAPGAMCFEEGKEYEHGGVSPQECVVPRLTVTAGVLSSTTAAPQITKIKWFGLLCRIELSGVTDGVLVDLRALPGDPSTSIAEQAKETTTPGKLSLLVPDEDHEGESAYLVLVAPSGEIFAQREVVVGSNQ